MKTLEEKAQEYVDTLNLTHEAKQNIDRSDFERAYIAGATEALASQWRSVEDELPEMFTRVLVCIKEPNGFSRIHIGKRIYHDTTNPKDDK